MGQNPLRPFEKAATGTDLGGGDGRRIGGGQHGVEMGETERIFKFAIDASTVQP
jgi:hypothetical protein